MTDEPWTIGRLLNWTTEFLTEKGSSSPRLDAEVLLAHARGCQRIELYTAFEETAGDDLRAGFRKLVQERAAGKPVAYLVGHREFFSLSFRVSPDVLIPRPETEQLVVRALDIAKEAGRQALRVADIGTGSGVLAVCLAKHLPGATVTATDISPAALEVARQNATDHGVDDRIDFVEANLFGPQPAEPAFDLIVSNPPYITTAEMAELDPGVRDYEPHAALHGGGQGTNVIERLLPAAAERIRPSGRLLIEVSPATAGPAAAFANQSPGLTHVETHADLAGHPRVVEYLREEG